MTPTATRGTAALAGLFSGVAMPLLWPRLGDDSLYWIAAFLLVIALPAHAFVVGFGQRPVAGSGMDAALLKRIGVWLLASIVAAVVMQALRR